MRNDSFEQKNTSFLLKIAFKKPSILVFLFFVRKRTEKKGLNYGY